MSRDSGGSALTFTAAATGGNSGDTLAYSLTGQTHGASITAQGAFRWTPAGAQGGSADNPYQFTVRVDDGQGGTDERDVWITATEANQKPRFISNKGEALHCSWNTTESALSWQVDLEVADDDLPEQTLQYMGGTDALPGAPNNIPLTTVSGGLIGIPGIPLNVTSPDNLLVYEFALLDGLGGKAFFFISVYLPGHAQYPAETSCDAVDLHKCGPWEAPPC